MVAAVRAVRAAMLAYPEAEWVCWVDADAAFADMDAGVFLIRNYQWAPDLMDAWARMGPAYPEHAAWGKAMREELAGKPDAEADDQSALMYLLARDPGGARRWPNRTRLETGYYFQGYWAEIVGRLDGVAARYAAAEREWAAGERDREWARMGDRYL
ncbi:probable glycosyltransferase 6 [Panicum virgatum]|uniref:probable glycosyltransferase 6 n=1 Tax=Panicum virgatum TaxID=38727 RepID=UPI0019D66D08|nr:probable glycosyltransferase 6 [Panicum virgatum]